MLKKLKQKTQIRIKIFNNILLILIFLFLIIIINSKNVNASVQSSVGVVGKYGDPCVSDEYCTTNHCIGGCCLYISAIETDYDKYSPNVTANIYGYNFTINSSVSLDIINESNESINGYPINVSTDENGSFISSWFINVSYGNYTIIGTDNNNSDVFSEKKVEILPLYIIKGRIVNSNNETLNSTTKLYENGNLIKNGTSIFNFTLEYGVKYDFIIRPNINNINYINITGIVNIGNLNDIFFGIETPDISTFRSSYSFFPNFNNFDIIKVNISFENTLRNALYKCTNWSFFENKCNNDFNMTNIFQDGITSYTINFTLNDPCFSIGSSCGNSICEGSENSFNCPNDCGFPEKKGSGGGGHAIGFPIPPPRQNITNATNKIPRQNTTNATNGTIIYNQSFKWNVTPSPYLALFFTTMIKHMFIVTFLIIVLIILFILLYMGFKKYKRYNEE